MNDTRSRDKTYGIQNERYKKCETRAMVFRMNDTRMPIHRAPEVDLESQATTLDHYIPAFGLTESGTGANGFMLVGDQGEQDSLSHRMRRKTNENKILVQLISGGSIRQAATSILRLLGERQWIPRFRPQGRPSKYCGHPSSGRLELRVASPVLRALIGHNHAKGYDASPGTSEYQPRLDDSWSGSTSPGTSKLVPAARTGAGGRNFEKQTPGPWPGRR
uniref:Uncharacterized protein n=1 Tax=Timema cristinae TaxID=61476 RepID=A0A7R9CS64_TIMCR|nr:unnamed protein product [Timema cristinae]